MFDINDTLEDKVLNIMCLTCFWINILLLGSNSKDRWEEGFLAETVQHQQILLI